MYFAVLGDIKAALSAKKVFVIAEKFFTSLSGQPFVLAEIMKSENPGSGCGPLACHTSFGAGATNGSLVVHRECRASALTNAKPQNLLSNSDLLSNSYRYSTSNFRRCRFGILMARAIRARSRASVPSLP
jgi:hypothetical protein